MQKTFGILVLEARKSRLWSQRELAGRLLKEDGTPISQQYLNDIERDRRTASEHLIHQFSAVLNLDSDLLCALTGTMPSDIVKFAVDQPDEAAEAFRLMRQRVPKRRR